MTNALIPNIVTRKNGYTVVTLGAEYRYTWQIWDAQGNVVQRLPIEYAHVRNATARRAGRIALDKFIREMPRNEDFEP